MWYCRISQPEEETLSFRTSDHCTTDSAYKKTWKSGKEDHPRTGCLGSKCSICWWSHHHQQQQQFPDSRHYQPLLKLAILDRSFDMRQILLSRKIFNDYRTVLLYAFLTFSTNMQIYIFCLVTIFLSIYFL